jgi:DNA-binding Lrp family transcriptional regulator
MDEINSKIIEELARDSQMHFSAIAKKIGVSPETIRQRYKKMRENKRINCCMCIDFQKLGYINAYLMIKHSSKQEKSATLVTLSKIPGIIRSSETAGDCDFFVVVQAKNMKRFNEILKAIKMIGVDSIEFSISHNQWIRFSSKKNI